MGVDHQQAGPHAAEIKFQHEVNLSKAAWRVGELPRLGQVVVKDLEQSFSSDKKLKKFTIEPHGSMISGLNTSSSDVDIMIQKPLTRNGKHLFLAI
jgi:hypothetical protein